MIFTKNPRIKDPSLLADVRTRPCAVGLKCWGKVEPHHLKHRGAGGGDTEENCIPLCQKHHSQYHAEGFERFLEKFTSCMEMGALMKLMDFVSTRGLVGFSLTTAQRGMR